MIFLDCGTPCTHIYVSTLCTSSYSMAHVCVGGEGTAEGRQRPVEAPPMSEGASSVSGIPPPATDEYVTHTTYSM